MTNRTNNELDSKPLIPKFISGFLMLGFIYAYFFLLFYPILFNADALLNADEVFHANAIIDWLKGGPFFLYYEGVFYHGIVGGLSAVPFFWMLGITAMAFKMAGLLYYSLYIWTFYLIGRHFGRSEGNILLFLLLISPTHLAHIATINVPFSVIGFLGNLIFLFFLKVKSSDKDLSRNVFFLSAIIGFSIYAFTYSILHIFTVFVLFILTHPEWNSIRNRIFASSFLNMFRNLSSKKLVLVRILDLMILAFIPVIIFSYIFGGFGFDFAEVSIIQSNKLHKPVIQLLAVIIVRVIIYRMDLLIYFDKLKKYIIGISAGAKRLIGLGIGGFLLGIFPRIISIATGEITRGGEGFDIDFSPLKLTSHFWMLVSTVIPEALDIKHPIIDLVSSDEYSLLSITMVIAAFLMTGLYLAAAYSFHSSNRSEIKKIFRLEHTEFNVRLIILLFPILLCTSVIISNSGPVAGYLFTLNGMMSVWVAIYLNKIRNQSIAVFVLLMSLWGGFHLSTLYRSYIQYSIIQGITPSKIKEPLYEVIDFCNSKGITVAYSDYGTGPKATFLSKGTLIVNENAKSSRGKKLRAKTVDNFSFAVISNSNSKKVYESFFAEKGIRFQDQMIDNYYIYWGFEGEKGEIDKLRSLFD